MRSMGRLFIAILAIGVVGAPLCGADPPVVAAFEGRSALPELMQAAQGPADFIFNVPVSLKGIMPEVTQFRVDCVVRYDGQDVAQGSSAIFPVPSNGVFPSQNVTILVRYLAGKPRVPNDKAALYICYPVIKHENYWAGFSLKSSAPAWQQARNIGAHSEGISSGPVPAVAP